MTTNLSALLPASGFPGQFATVLLGELVDHADEWLRVVQSEVTKRADIAAREAVMLSSIASRREVLLTYLDLAFDERAENFRQLFAQLDQAMRANPAAVPQVLGSITALALKNPFSDLADPEVFRAMFNDPEHEWIV